MERRCITTAIAKFGFSIGAWSRQTIPQRDGLPLLGPYVARVMQPLQLSGDSMRPHAFTCAIALALCALASCGRDADRDMSKDLSRATPPPRTTTTAPANTPANVGAPTQAEKRDGANPQQ